MLPGPLKDLATRADYLLSQRVIPFYSNSSGQPHTLGKGAVTISLDFELAWGWSYATRPVDPVARGLREREHVPILLRHFENYGVPATWATVGHLFLASCSRGTGGKAHESMARLQPFRSPRYNFAAGDWFQHDPCTDVHRDPAWYGPDLVERVMASRVGHEVGCHSFSHASFGTSCPPEVAEAELDACIDAMKPYGLRPTTWVFPRHDAGNHTVLARKGVQNVRAPQIQSLCLGLPVLRGDGMWDIPVATALDRGAEWPLEWRLQRLKRAVDVAARTRQCAHIWLHPSLPMAQIDQVLVPFLGYCAEQREQGLIDVLTMAQLVAVAEGAKGS